MMLMNGRNDHIDFDGCNSISLNMRRLKLDAFQMKFRYFQSQLVDGNAGTHKRTKRHVAADAGYRIEVCYVHILCKFTKLLPDRKEHVPSCQCVV